MKKVCCSKKIDGIKIFSSINSNNEKEFRSKSFPFLFKVEDKNFWFKNRRELIYKILKKYIPDLKSKKMLEIGCGCGNVLNYLNQNGVYCEGADVHLEALKFARKYTNKQLYQLDAKKIPFINKFDIIGMFDVLEHIKDEKRVISQIYKTLKPNGFLIITVPASPFLWSKLDEIAFHKKRYRISDLEKLFNECGFRTKWKNYFIFFLLPFLILSRKKLKKKCSIEKAHKFARNQFRLNNILNKIFYIISKFEQIFIVNLNIQLPCGSSCLFLIQKI